MIVDNIEVARIKFAGRWASETAMSAYIQESMSLLVLAQLDPATRAQLQALLTEHCIVWNGPPGPRWQAFFSRRRQWRSLGRGLPQQSSRELQALFLSEPAPSVWATIRSAVG